MSLCYNDNLHLCSLILMTICLFVFKVWIEDLKPKLNDLDTKPDLIAAVGIILLWDRYNLPLDENNKNALFRSLILEGNDQEKNCPMYDKFKESFQGESFIL